MLLPLLHANVYCSFISTNHFATTTVFCTFVSLQTQSRICSSKTICTTARESHSLLTHDQNKTRPKTSIIIQRRNENHCRNRDTAHPQYPPANKHHLKLSNFIPIFEPNCRISTTISHHVRSHAFDRTPPQLDKTIGQACGSGNKVPRVLAHIW
jgi:hypothetical protein